MNMNAMESGQPGTVFFWSLPRPLCRGAGHLDGRTLGLRLPGLEK